MSRLVHTAAAITLLAAAPSPDARADDTPTLDLTLTATSWLLLGLGSAVDHFVEIEEPNHPMERAPAIDAAIRERFARDEPLDEFDSLASYAIFPHMALPFALRAFGDAPIHQAINTANSFAFAIGTQQLISTFVARERPDGSNNESFFSGHATGAFVAGAATAAALDDLGAPPWTRTAAWTISGGLALSRIIDDKHFASDVIAGSLFGAAVGLWFQRDGLITHPHQLSLATTSDGTPILALSTEL